jgi:hypothetical protein
MKAEKYLIATPTNHILVGWTSFKENFEISKKNSLRPSSDCHNKSKTIPPTLLDDG